MKSKFLKLASIVTLSAFLAMTAVVCPATAASITNTNDCGHSHAKLLNNIRIFPHADRTMHQAADYCTYYCYDCKKEFTETHIIGTFYHTFVEYAEYGECTQCHYRYY